MGGCIAEVYAGICRPWLYLTFRSGGLLVTARVNLEGGLLGPLVYWLRNLVSLPKIMGASDQDEVQSKNCSISRKMGASVLNRSCSLKSFPIRTGSFFPSKS